jgi:hypothetical protein
MIGYGQICGVCLSWRCPLSPALKTIYYYGLRGLGKGSEVVGGGEGSHLKRCFLR